MKKFLFNIFLFVAGLVMIDRVIYYSLQYARPIDYKLFIDAKKDFFKEDKEYDILLIGDSHIANAIDPRILLSELNMSAFNLGIYSSSPFEWYFTVKAALNAAKQKPKIVMIGTNPAMFSRKVAVGQYTPLIVNDFTTHLKLGLYSDEALQSSFFFKSVKEQYLFEAVVNKITGKKYVPTRDIYTTSNGYLEVRNQIPGTNWNKFELETKLPINIKQIDYFNKTISFLIEKNIKVIIINPPMYFDSLEAESENRFNEFRRILDSSALKYKIPVFNQNYTVLKDSLQQNDFLNTGHLNFYGAKKFTYKLSYWMKDNGFKGTE
jgi:hypothetical protein